jgi:hypothetical protein
MSHIVWVYLGLAAASWVGGFLGAAGVQHILELLTGRSPSEDGE